MGFYFADRNKFITVLACLFMTAMVAFPQVTETASKSAIHIWANAIVPVLLPFFIFADFVKRSGYLDKLPPGIYAFAAAFLSGYPMGAKVTGDLITGRILSEEEGRWVASYAMITGPGFLMGAVSTFLGSIPAACAVAAAHYGGALLNGLLWHCRHCSVSRKHSDVSQIPHGSLFDAFSRSIMTSFKSMAVILAWLIVFMIGIHLMEKAGVYNAVGNETAASLIKGMLEMTAGASMIGVCNISLQTKTVLVSFLVSFGGLSVIGQSASMAAGSGITVMDILKRKLTHGLFAGILAVILVRFVL